MKNLKITIRQDNPRSFCSVEFRDISQYIYFTRTKSRSVRQCHFYGTRLAEDAYLRVKTKLSSKSTNDLQRFIHLVLDNCNPAKGGYVNVVERC